MLGDATKNGATKSNAAKSDANTKSKQGEEGLHALKKVEVVLKGSQKNILTKCLKEVGLLRNLSHPNIVRYSDCFLSGPLLYILLEWCPHGDLKGVITRTKRENSRLGEKVVWSYFSQCCGAIRHMHGQRIIHRDVKPSNVLIAEGGVVKLGDLGLGRYVVQG